MRNILDCNHETVKDLTSIQRKRIERSLDKLGIEKNGTVQLNLGKREKVTKDTR